MALVFTSAAAINNASYHLGMFNDGRKHFQTTSLEEGNVPTIPFPLHANHRSFSLCRAKHFNQFAKYQHAVKPKLPINGLPKYDFRRIVLRYSYKQSRLDAVSPHDPKPMIINRHSLHFFFQRFLLVTFSLEGIPRDAAQGISCLTNSNLQ